MFTPCFFGPKQEGRCYAVAFSPDSTHMAVGADTNNISLLDVGSGEVRNVIYGHTDYVRAITFSSGKLWRGFCSSDQKVKPSKKEKERQRDRESDTARKKS